MVDDSQPIIDSWRLIFGGTGVQFDDAATMRGCTAKLKLHHPDCVVLDLNLPDSHGPETVSRVKEVDPDVAVVVVTGENDAATAAACYRNGAQDCLIKGQFDPPLLLRSVLLAIVGKRLAEEGARRQRLLEELQAEVKTLRGENTDDRLSQTIKRLEMLAQGERGAPTVNGAAGGADQHPSGNSEPPPVPPGHQPGGDAGGA
jgi:DNA-binding NtrC family response regulator